MTYLLEPEIQPRRLSGQRRASPSRVDGVSGPWREELRAIVSRKVVPHLLARPVRRAEGSKRFSPDQVDSFASLVAADAVGAAAGAVENALAVGASLESVFVDLLAPAARRLGDLWLADTLSFVDVTRGTAVLQGLLRRFGPAFEDEAGAEASGGSIFLMPVPGEQHVFGLSMLAAFFRRAGWRVVYEPGIGAADAAACLAAEPFDVLGVSAAGSRFAARLPDLLATLREDAANPRLSVLVGGPAFLDGTMRAADVGADAVAEDAPHALRCAAAALAGRVPTTRAAVA